mmetsp:Transcript_59680/g.129253  ORF Transcript_59680/g.129253 Transcript_59680/m.129253 type:complete len:309 (+) Transcript_59680:91-1017(+)
MIFQSRLFSFVLGGLLVLALIPLSLPFMTWSSPCLPCTRVSQALNSRMQPTLERLPLGSDLEDWSKRPRRAPSFTELYKQLYLSDYEADSNVLTSFPNPYNLEPHMDYPHSSLWQKGSEIMARVVQELGLEKIKFIVEAGSMHGGSAIRMAMELDERGLHDVPILCIDPWTGDLNMWLNRVVWEHLGVRDGRATTYDQFVVNVRQAIADSAISSHHIIAFPVTSIIGARWLQATGFAPSLIYLDSAHEIDETYYELCLYYHILEPGGMLMGDDYGWTAVQMDVNRFVKDKGLKLNFFGVFTNWWVRKP